MKKIVKGKDGKTYIITVPDWDIPNPAAINLGESSTSGSLS